MIDYIDCEFISYLYYGKAQKEEKRVLQIVCSHSHSSDRSRSRSKHKKREYSDDESEGQIKHNASYFKFLNVYSK